MKILLKVNTTYLIYIVIWLFIGESKILWGQQDSDTSNLLLEDEQKTTYKDIMLKNKKVLQLLNPSEYDNLIESESYNNGFYKTYEISIDDINWVFINNINPLLAEAGQEYYENSDVRLNNFDIKIILEIWTLPKSNELYKNRLFWDIGKLSLNIEQSKLSSLIDYYQQFMSSYAKTVDAISKFKSKVLDNSEIAQQLIRTRSKDDSSFRRYSHSANIYGNSFS